MADDAGMEPDMTEHRKPRDHGMEDSPVKDGDGKVEEETNNQRSDAERVQSEEKEEKKEVEKKPSKLKEMWAKLGLDMGTVLMMFKGSCAPIIAISFYQADSVAATYTTLGYLVPIITVLSVAIMPRAKFIQNLILNVLAVCIGSAVALLGIWSGVQARKHTTAPRSTARYNSSQAAVCAIWLFANIWFVNVLRAKMPALQFPVIIYSIFTNVAFTYGPLFPTINAGEALIVQLLKGFLTAFAICLGVNLFIIPVSSRTVVFKEQAGYLQLIRGTMKAQTAYLQSLETSDMFAPEDPAEDDDENLDDNRKAKKSKKKKDKSSHPAANAQAIALKGSLAALTALHGKLHGDMEFGKRETAWGKLDAKDIDEIFKLFRKILIPLIGMSTITDIFERIAERRGWVKVPNSKFDRAESWEACGKEAKEKEKQTWNEVMKTLHEPFEVVTAAMDEGLQHAGLLLELIPKPKKAKEADVEEKADGPKPGDKDFAKYLDKKIVEFYSRRGETLKAWARQKGITTEEFDATKPPAKGEDWTPDAAQHRRDQQQLYLILYLEHLLYSAGLAISDLIKFADQKVEEGTMTKNRFIFPGKRRLRKWILNVGREDTTVDIESPDSAAAGINTVYMGAGFNPKKDPEHLPPQTTWQHFGNGLRTIPHFLGSAESAFGFRVACATLSVGIVAFLKDTQTFFIEQRLVWAMIIIVSIPLVYSLALSLEDFSCLNYDSQTNLTKAIGMSMTSGQSIFGFIGRVIGTAIAMVCSLVIWYIVDQKTPGILVMLWLFIFLEMYFFIKFQRFIAIFLISIVTQILIIGYELQVRKIGIVAASASGQPYYPIYELAPYRLACVAGGSFVAFIWTIFPYPLTDRSWLRKDLGSTLYLLANYYSMVHSTIGARMHGTEGDLTLKSSPGRQLEKARHKIFGKLLLLLPSLKQHADFQEFEFSIGGKFPRPTYDGIILRATGIMNYLTLMSYATNSWVQDNGAIYPNTTVERRHEWLDALSKLVDTINPTSHGITSILSLLSASVTQGSALPPFIQLPEPYDLSRRLEALDSGILDARHVEEPGYSAYAVLQVCSSLVTDDLARLVDHVKDLVGETDFSFKVSVSETSVDSTASERSSGKGKKE